MVNKMNAKYHLERCLKEERDYSIGKAHCRLASLYKDFDPQLRDVTELQFQVKWKRCNEAAPVLERIVKNHPTDETWAMIHKMFVTAASQSTSVERDVFMEISTDILESILSGLSKRFDSNDCLKTKVLLFAVQTSTEEKHAKLVVRAVTYLCDKINTSDVIVNGVGKYHVYIAVIVAPTLLKRNLSHIPLSYTLTIITTTIHVALVWATNRQQWEQVLKEVSPNYKDISEYFTINSWEVICAAIDKSIHSYDLGAAAINLHTHTNDCAEMLKCIEKATTAKSELKKTLLEFFVWRAYSIWRKLIAEDELLAWQPANNWSTDVDKIIDDKFEVINERGSPAKKSRSSRERRDTVVTPVVANMIESSRKQVCDAYELCCAAMCAFGGTMNVVEPEGAFRLARFFPDVQQLISESYLFKCKLEEAIAHLNERLERSDKRPSDADVLYLQLACVNAIAKNWSDTYECVFSILRNVRNYKCEEQSEGMDDTTQTSTNLSYFFIIKKCDMESLVYDILHHIFFKVYTSTTVDHENDHLLGALLVLSQIKFAEKGFRSFNRIMRHIEAKGSLNYPGLVTHITNMAILEEISRVHEYCTEYVNIQVALPQVHRRIGQSTRHSVRGTKDGQRQALEEQMKKWRNDPIETVAGYFTDENENILKMLESR